MPPVEFPIHTTANPWAGSSGATQVRFSGGWHCLGTVVPTSTLCVSELSFVSLPWREKFTLLRLARKKLPSSPRSGEEIFSVFTLGRHPHVPFLPQRAKKNLPFYCARIFFALSFTLRGRRELPSLQDVEVGPVVARWDATCRDLGSYAPAVYSLDIADSFRTGTRTPSDARPWESWPGWPCPWLKPSISFASRFRAFGYGYGF